jgi:hypothetical protein
VSTLTSFILVSLDGFSEGPNGEIDWPIIDQEFTRAAIHVRHARADLPADAACELSEAARASTCVRRAHPVGSRR